MEFSIQMLPPSMEKKHFVSQFFYVFIMFIITKFGENFEGQV